MPTGADPLDAANSPGESSSTAKDGSAGVSSPTPSASALQKKRKAGPGGRGVANLTPEQLAKKRANDREAQRNIRERTKAQIESLEQTIEQLRSQQPYQELQRVIREKEAVEAENADIRRRLATVMQLIQPMLAHTPDATDSASASQRHGSFGVPGGVSAVLPPADVPRAGYHHEQFINPSAEPPLSASSSNYSMPWQPSGSGSVAPSFAPRPRSPTGQPTLLGMASSIYRMTDGEQESFSLIRDGETRAGTVPKPIELVTRTGSAASFRPASSDSPSSSYQPISDGLPPWQKISAYSSATCTLDSIVLTYKAEVDKQIRAGQTPIHVLGPETPNWAYIKDPDAFPAEHDSSVGSLSRFLGRVLGQRMFPDLQKPPEKVGSAYLLYTSLYWTLSKDEKAYARVPPWLRPTDMQVKVMHGTWIDALFWPNMRDAVISNRSKYQFDDFFIPLTGTVSCNWPHSEAEIFDMGAMQTGQLVLSCRFVSHILNLDNWTLGSGFAKAYPQLGGTYVLRN